ncbi:N-acyl-D-amino-acid deacylase family protein [Intestinibacter bartlettii]|uniref:N-acyl-D-amino-acid deacylase family protein n=1 Tax=Intestinibacter bartlettii TaxID=261299 RepID=UPI000820C00A|nr:D-aminoacylase [Intestinibacter bartlettii]SCI64947.1 D-aminoacylase [uncultured Clostridium sp.]
MLDIKIKNGVIIDGSGKDAYKADLGITGDKITKIGDLSNEDAKTTIDAKGQAVSPGFIDMHTHSDMSLVYDRNASSRIRTGVTTDVIGNCGIGVAPVKEENKQLLLDYLGTRIVGSMPVKLELKWDSYESYIKYMEENPTAVNVAPLLAQGPIRIYEMGFSKEEPTDKELENMVELSDGCMKQGPLGMTSGLVYLPGEYTTQKELVELCKKVAKYDGFYATHMRNEGDEIFEAMDEAIDVARQSGVRLHISHLKCLGYRNFGQTDKLFEKINKAREEGLKVSFDVYPYNAGMTSLSAMLPPWMFEGGVDKMVERLADEKNRKQIVHDIENGLPGWQNFGGSLRSWDDVTIVSVTQDEDAWMEGMKLTEIAAKWDKDVYNTMFDILYKENGRVQITIVLMDENDVQTILSHPDSMVGSDSMSLATEGLLAKTSTHPRAFGTQAKVLGEFVREKKCFSLEEGVKKLTYNPAQILKIEGRGLLKEGNFADIVIFNPDTIKDMATYKNPKQYPVGIDTVIVNGVVAFEDSKQLEVLPGRFLKNSFASK